MCDYNAIAVLQDHTLVFPELCHGCGACSYFACPEEAIGMVENASGEWYISETKYDTLVHAKLTPPEENSGKLVTLVKNRAKEIAERDGLDLVLIDGSPGIGCPLIASLSGVSCSIIVTEPTISGLHDARWVVAVANHFGVPARAIVNKYDLNMEITGRIEEYFKRRSIDVVGKIAFEEAVVHAMVEGKTIVEF